MTEPLHPNTTLHGAHTEAEPSGAVAETVSRSPSGCDGERAASAGSEPSAPWRDIESGVTVEIAARHFDPNMDEGWHTHTFAVTIWRDGRPFTDGRSPREALRALLENLAPVGAHGVREFPPELWSNEAIANSVAVLANVIEVLVTRIDGPKFSVRARR